MQWVKIVRSKEVLSLILFSFLFIATRVPGLMSDEINPDGVNWHYRSQQFVNGLKYLQWEKTYQHYHPGVTLMWVTGIPIELTKQLLNQSVYTQDNFAVFNFAAKFSLVAVQLFLTVLCVYFLSKLFSFQKGLIIVSLFSLEPFFVGNSRLYHMDALFTLFVFLSLITGYLFIHSKKTFYIVLAGLFSALSFLTKSVGIGVFVYILGFLFLMAFTQRRKVFFSRTLILIFSFMTFTFAFFPALWVKPLYYLGEIFSESERVGVRDGHSQIIFGEFTEAAGPWFYPLVLLLKLSPFILMGSIFFLARSVIKRSRPKTFSSFSLFILIFYVGYFLVMTLPSKKLDRYMVVEYPLFAYFCYLGYEYFFTKVSRFISFPVTGILFSSFVLFPLVAVFPYYFTYTSPLFGTTENANKIIGQKPFGVGVCALKDFIVGKYGYKSLGLIDTKPLRSIYPNSLVYDIREYGPSKYDLVILGINEEFIGKAVSPEITFKESGFIEINGLKYWRIYEKVIK